MKALAVLVLALGLTACSSNSPYGNFTKTSEQQRSLNASMAADTAKQLQQTYAPAATKFVLIHPAKDVYGATLVKSLRDYGFAVAEAGSDNATDGHKLAYVIDYMDETRFVVTLRIGQGFASRLYGVEQNQLVPLSHWTRQE